MGEQGWEQVQGGFLWDTIAKRIEDIYIELLGLQEPPMCGVCGASHPEITAIVERCQNKNDTAGSLHS